MTAPTTQAALAAELGISAAMVSRLARQGMPTHNAADARAWRAQHVRARATPHADSDAPTSAGQRYALARAEREECEAALAALALAEQRKELVRAADITRELARVFSAFREALLQLPARIAPGVAVEPNEAACYRLIDAEVRQALEHLRTAEEGRAQ